MAVSKNDVLSFIAQHSTSDRPNVPAKEIIAVLGKEARSVIDELKKAGTIVGQRGRVGGVKIASASSAGETDTQSSTVADANEDVAAQFAALMEKLEADSEVEAAVAV